MYKVEIDIMADIRTGQFCSLGKYCSHQKIALTYLQKKKKKDKLEIVLVCCLLYKGKTFQC